MITIRSISIKEMRGIRDLTLALNSRSFVVSGHNGTGKSGVVDAIEFGLTGHISRLEGTGTGSSSLKSHGPHISKKGRPEFSEVTLEIQLIDSGEVVTLTRNMKTAADFSVDPETPEIRQILNEVANHPELVLSRREIIRFIIAQPGDRSKRVQLLLRLDGIEDTRRLLKAAENKIKTEFDLAKSDVGEKKEDLERHLQFSPDATEEFTEAINEARRILGLPTMEKLDEKTSFLNGVAITESPELIDKASLKRDVTEANDAIPDVIQTGNGYSTSVLAELSTIDSTEEFLEALKSADLILDGFALVDSSICPLCDHDWENIDSLKSHLEEKIASSNEAVEKRDRILKLAVDISSSARKLISKVAILESATRKLSMTEQSQKLLDWKTKLNGTSSSCSSVDEILNMKDVLESDWTECPSELEEIVNSLIGSVNLLPEPSETVTATQYLSVAQERFSALAKAKLTASELEIAASASTTAYAEYCSAADESLENLYKSVESDFSRYYQVLNGDDEIGFKAQFEQDGGKLNLEVDFYGLGMYPPHAYHSEGHQDGMGVCLYLALMKQIMPDQFRFAVLDDVVMSIDVGHRKRFCQLLASEFSQTQFVITTHDRVWARQMRTAGLVGARAGVEFTGWSVETGPIFEEIDDVWEKIETDLLSNDVNSAGARLRHYLEYVSSELADNLGAPVKYRIDSDYDFGELWSGLVGRYTKLLAAASKSASSWGRNDQEAIVNDRRAAWLLAKDRYGSEGWVVNKVVHYNEWTTISPDEFRAVVTAVRSVLAELKCSRPECNSWLYVTPPKGDADNLRCRCEAITLNLRSK